MEYLGLVGLRNKIVTFARFHWLILSQQIINPHPRAVVLHDIHIVMLRDMGSDFLVGKGGDPVQVHLVVVFHIRRHSLSIQVGSVHEHLRTDN